MICPTCNRAFPPGSAACPYDGSPLVDEQDNSGGWNAATLAQDEPAPPPRALPSHKVRVTAQQPRPAQQPRAASQPGVRVGSQPMVRTGPPAQARTGSQPHGRTGPEQPSHVTSAMSPSRIRAAEGSAPAVPVAAPAAPAGPALQPYPSVPANVELPPGTMVGEYQITGLLGTGGMGSVYAGIQPVIGKRVAIKVLLRELAANPQVVARFMQEARAVNQAQSRYIVDIFSFGELPDGRQYFVMEYLEGHSLRHFLRDRKVLAFDEAYAILSCVTKGLIAAHHKGIIHRDIKPENIMVKVEEDGGLSATVLDFGIAKLQGGDSSSPGFATRTGAAMGTPYYMSPEQCRGVAVDHRTDIYALGIIMFEMFTGALPFTARSYIDLVNKHLFASPPEPSKLRNNISPVLENLILRCIEKDPAERPHTVEQVLQELQQAAPSLRGTNFTLEPVVGMENNDPVVVPITGGAPASTKAGAAGAAPAAAKPRGLKVAVIVFLAAVLVVGGAVAAYLVHQSRKGGPGTGDGTTGGLAGGSAPRTPDAKPSARVTSPRSDAAAVTPRRGSLRIRTGVSGAVYRLDDREVGSGAELSLADVKPGAHSLRITAPGHADHEQTVTVEAGVIFRLELQLQPKRTGKTPKKKITKGQKKDEKGSTNPEDPDGTLNPFNRKR